MADDFTGYNAAEVEALGTQIKNAADNISTSIVTEIKNGIVTPMADAWFSPEGVEFFEAFATTVQGTATTIEEAFNTFVSGVESAGNNWGSNIKGTQVSLTRVSGLDLTLDVSAIQDNQGGNQGIREAAATATASSIGTVQSTIMSQLSSISSGLTASTAFLGHGQDQAVSECFGKVAEAIANIFKFLTEGDNSLQSSINKAVTKYSDVANDTTTEFNNVS